VAVNKNWKPLKGAKDSQAWDFFRPFQGLYTLFVTHLPRLTPWATFFRPFQGLADLGYS
jgi:hypothetical protein